MNILLTCLGLRRLGGAQVNVRDLALGLQKRGHSVLAYCDLAPDPADSLADDQVPITTCLNSLPFMPDVIHGHHHLDTMTALTALPGVPAVYACGGANHMGKQPKHPRILQYVAMSPTLALRMAIESGIDESLIEVVYNAVDLQRFRVVRTPPERPRRALVYTRNLGPDTLVGQGIRQAAVLAGLELEFRGLGPNQMHLFSPEEALPNYDLVFASGKSAIDALACGCAVILVGSTGSGEMVREANLDRLRRANFVVAMNSPPPSSATILGQIESYSAADAAATSRRLRGIAGFDGYIDHFLAIYQRVIEAYRQAPPDLRAEQGAVARYLRTLAPFTKTIDGPPVDQTKPLNYDFLRAGISRQLATISMTQSGTGCDANTDNQ